ncbi:MAG: DUF547 domain-containing protein [Planctomycetota bacterium]|jgi:hypothetical protein
MEFINQRNKKILIILALLGFLCASHLSLQKAVAEEKKSAPAPKTEKKDDPKQPAPPAPDPNHTPDKSADDALIDDPNEMMDDDSFLPKLSTLVLLQETYDHIYTPELITDDGLVKYSILRRKRTDMLNAEKLLKNIHPALLMSMTRQEKIAFWINAYNTCTLKLIIDNYPIKPKMYMIWYPDNSIMQISGAWTKKYFWIADEQLTLKEIEKEYLLQRYNDPRICFALANSTQSGAILSNRQYKGETLKEQLDEQVKKFLNSPDSFKLDKKNRVVYLSYVFQMNKTAFLESDFAKIRRFRERKKPEERAWLNFILTYLSKEESEFFNGQDFEIDFIKYNWELNETK